MATPNRHSTLSARLAWLRSSWRGIAWGVGKVLVLLLVVMEVVLGLVGAGTVAFLNALFVVALFVVSLVYLLFVSSRVRLFVPAIDTQGEGGRAREAGRARMFARRDDAPADAPATVQVARLSTNAARVIIANDAPIPVLRAQAALKLVREYAPVSSAVSAATPAQKTTGKPFSIPARGVQPTSVSHAFDHVGIYRLDSGGIRVFDLLGLLSRVRGVSGQWRVRVVPNVYRLTYGIPQQRRVVQRTLGLPDTTADALDYDRVREYRPGDPLKTIHWKIVAHGGGELYTKLFETPTASAATMVIDPYGPDVVDGSIDAALKMHDAMLEGGFSLMEHARENGVEGTLRFVDRSGTPVETRWEGPAMLGWFVETARRPSMTAATLTQSITGIRALRNAASGYVLFVTSALTAETTQALISCYHAGVPLMVLHVMCAPSRSMYASQHAYSERLRKASIAVVELDDGPSIVKAVTLQ